ncbi:SAC3/GANP domain protein [Microthyrium microscopicum]|uniref:SAC3/GANP domain protein n=1 Tax=Microthyrium microscopicum TaxID=703497 RepID=A0A6A6UMD8_9PEZI|nr:SAC3/GANP domain protein [Microthyrium microscopicum]
MSSSLTPAFTAVQSPRTALPMSVTPSESTPPKARQIFPEPVKEYVRRSFAEENAIPGIDSNELNIELKSTITAAAESGNLHNIDWATLPLPQQAIQQRRLHQQQPWTHHSTPSHHIYSNSSPSSIMPNPNRKRSFEEHAIANPETPPWRKKAGKGAFENRDMYNNKAKTNKEKRQKKTMVFEPSSKFQEQLQNRQKRFNLNAHSESSSSQEDDDDNTASTGPVVGTSTEIVKGYFRLTRQPRPNEVRPQPVLEQALDMVKAKWKFNSDYNFVCDQLKSIRQDLTVQRIKNAFTVKVYETHALIALEKGDLGEYNQCQTQLRALYTLKLGGRPSEFMAYRILYMIYSANRSSMNNLLAELTPADKEKSAIKHALQVRSAITFSNYHKLFKLYHECPNMGPWLMDMFINRERLRALATICKAYNSQSLPVAFVAEELGFDSYDHAAQFVIDNGASAHLIQQPDNSFLLNTKAKDIFLHAQKAAFQKIDIKGQI